MLTERKGAIALLIAAAGFLSMPAVAVEVTEPAGAAHGYPSLCDLNGKKLADGEFRQWIENKLLHVVITYKFPSGQLFEERAQFRQQPELTQETWSWRELSNGKPQREFTVDFSSGIASAQIRNDNKEVSQKIEVEPGRMFAGFGFTIALGNLRRSRIGQPNFRVGHMNKQFRGRLFIFPHAQTTSCYGDNFSRRSAHSC